MFGFQAMDALREQMTADRRNRFEGDARSDRQRRQALRARRWPRVRSPLDDIDLDVEFGPARPRVPDPVADRGLPTVTAGSAPTEPAVPAITLDPESQSRRTFASTASD